MSVSTKPALRTPTTARSGPSTSPSAERTSGQQFVVMALTMSWQLALAILVPVLAGVALGKAFGNSTTWVLAGLAVALVASALVMWRTLQMANRLPVPKLSAAEKRKIKKSYEKEDD